MILKTEKQNEDGQLKQIVVHNRVQSTYDTLPTKIETVPVEAYRFFHSYTLNDTEKQRLCVEADTEYKIPLQCGNTC